MNLFTHHSFCPTVFNYVCQSFVFVSTDSNYIILWKCSHVKLTSLSIFEYWNSFTAHLLRNMIRFDNNPWYIIRKVLSMLFYMISMLFYILFFMKKIRNIQVHVHILSQLWFDYFLGLMFILIFFVPSHASCVTVQ